MISGVAAMPLFEISFGSSSTAMPVELPVLAGTHRDHIFHEAIPSGSLGPWHLFNQGRWLLGFASLPIKSDLEAVSKELYTLMLQALGGWHLCRIWNYVPRINAYDAPDLENYRSFCHARSLVFEQHYGRDFKLHLPAASAVGCDGNQLVVAFVASALEPTCFENPYQVPAYEYPLEHGPRPPSFSRATLLPADGELSDVFISGTAAIKGHRTIAPGDTLSQLGHTLENLGILGNVLGLGEALGAGEACSRSVKVSLRKAEDLQNVRSVLERRLLHSAGKVAYLKSDICRADLCVEIAMSILGVRSAVG